MIRSYAIGDIHGQIDLLRAAHQRIAADRAHHGDMDAPVIHLGDLTDRGPESRAVIDYLLDGIAKGAPWIVIKGNHDRMFALFCRARPMRDTVLRPGLDWLHPRLGGSTTLASYGISNAWERFLPEVHGEARKLVPAAHLDFLENLPLWHRRGPVFFVHAGIRPGVALTHQTEDDLLWIRREFHDSDADHGALIVHGHTPIDVATDYGNRINLDTGAAYGGPLTAAVFEDDQRFELTDNGRATFNRPPPQESEA